MQQEFTKFLAVISIVVVAICMILAILGTIGAVKITDGCFLRYNFDDNGTPIDQISTTVNVNANGNNSAINTPGPDGNPIITPDPNGYGKWLNSNLVVTSGQTIAYQIKGEVSLCLSYIPLNNLQNTNNLDQTGARIPIPRVEDQSQVPISLYFDAKTDEWRNIAQIFKNDNIIISASPEHKNQTDSSGNIIPATNISFSDIFTGNTITADCSDGKKIYSPICGKFSIYKGPYVNGCTYNPNCYQTCESKCCYGLPIGDGLCSGSQGPCIVAWCSCQECSWNSCYVNAFGDMPEPYKSDGTFTQQYSTNWNELIRNFQPRCNLGPPSYISNGGQFIPPNPDYLNQRFMWFSADTVTGLLYRIDTSETPTNPTIRGNNWEFARLTTDQSAYSNFSGYNIIYNLTGYSYGPDIGYLQYRFHPNDGQFAGDTGGYVLNIKHTKCRRSNGSVLSDTFVGRGTVMAAVVPFGQDPNVSAASNAYAMLADADGNGSFQVPATGGVNGNLWIRINNNQSDYKDSTGQYAIHIMSSTQAGSFVTLILNPLLGLKQRIQDAGTTIFQNMTCYQSATTGTCTNFFNYVRAMLSLYIAFQGAMFLLGMVRMNQQELVIKIIKTIIVAGLLNEKAFIFFNSNVFPFVTEFCDAMIANIAGYSMYTNTGTITNPLMFTDTLMSRLLFSQTFLGQVMALLSMGISGVLYFVLIFIAIIITVITLLRAISVYIMAFCAIAVLLGIAPLFLTFMLFDSTRYLFDNWVRFTVRYMVEPVVLFAGIIVLTQLFTIYLDYAVGYSVCWKCALPLKIPFPSIPGFDPAFANVPLFCLNWFAPWGLDQMSGMMGVNIQHIISVMIIAYCMYGYTDLSGKMVVKLVGGFGGPSATSMGQGMSSAFENKALKSVGLDQKSRKEIAGGAKQRLKNRVSAIDNYKKDRAGGPKDNKSGGDAKPENNNAQKNE
jgi:type IV secretion system protein VirB6